MSDNRLIRDTLLGSTILDEAKACVLGSRSVDYGRCYPLYRKMADIFNALFAHKIRTDEGCIFTASDMAMTQIVLKLCREQYKAKRDNRVDIAGYAEVLDEIQQDIDRMFGGKDAIQDERT